MIYVFKCQQCGETTERALPVAQRDAHTVYCDNPSCVSLYGMVRQPTASRFTIKGYREANGYSDEKV